jgi:hypothetical protein
VVDLNWYFRRMAAMGPAEITGRVEDKVWQAALKNGRRMVRTGRVAVTPFPAPVGEVAADATATKHLIACADRILEGRWTVLGVERSDMVPVPDWFLDPTSGIVAPSGDYAFSIPHRDPAVVGSIKQVWEPSRHHHLTVLAAAFSVTGDARYAETVDRHLRHWWEHNPFLQGPHWTSGIELGIRLISWTWVRRLLARWEGVERLFDDNPLFHRQLHDHQWFLARFPSRGSSANNHLVAEVAGLYVATTAFPWFETSTDWATAARSTLIEQVEAQTFASGLNRELASEYHGLVLELFLAAAVEATLAGVPFGSAYWARLRAMFDALAAVVDVTGRPPRQGDSDDGQGLVVDDPEYNRWGSIISTGTAMFGALPWWPDGTPAVRNALLDPLAAPPPLPDDRPSARPDVFADAGMALLRSAAGSAPELWCRFDAGPMGFLSIAAHGHADALAVEVRIDGVDIFADPGTYTYHAEPEWREYFRSTRAHNTLEIGGEDQSVPGGPFMWVRQARSRLEVMTEDGRAITCSGMHDGYTRFDPPVRHYRRVVIDDGVLELVDSIDGALDRDVRLAFHLGPAVHCELAGATAQLRWPGGDARLELPAKLTWEAWRGNTMPIAGWYSPGFGRREPATTLWGSGTLAPGHELITTLAPATTA